MQRQISLIDFDLDSTGSERPRKREERFRQFSVVEHNQTNFETFQAAFDALDQSRTRWAHCVHTDGARVHVQGAIHFENRRSIRQVAAFFGIPEAQVRPLHGRGAFTGYLHYLARGGEVELVTSPGVAGALNPAPNLESIRLAIFKGEMTLAEVADSHPAIYLQYHKRLAEADELRREREQVLQLENAELARQQAAEQARERARQEAERKQERERQRAEEEAERERQRVEEAARQRAALEAEMEATKEQREAEEAARAEQHRLDQLIDWISVDAAIRGHRSTRRLAVEKHVAEWAGVEVDGVSVDHLSAYVMRELMDEFAQADLADVMDFYVDITGQVLADMQPDPDAPEVDPEIVFAVVLTDEVRHELAGELAIFADEVERAPHEIAMAELHIPETVAEARASAPMAKALGLRKSIADFPDIYSPAPAPRSDLKPAIKDQLLAVGQG